MASLKTASKSLRRAAQEIATIYLPGSCSTGTCEDTNGPGKKPGKKRNRLRVRTMKESWLG